MSALTDGTVLTNALPGPVIEIVEGAGTVYLRDLQIRDGATAYPDPLSQALVLTAIVIGFAMTAFLLVQALRTHADTGTDHVDGEGEAADGRDDEDGR